MPRTPRQSHVMAIILAIIAGGLIPASFGFLTKIYEIRSQQPAAVSNLKSAADIYSLLFEIKRTTGADRVLLLRAHDSGGPIPNKSSVVAEVLVDDMEQIFTDWQSQPLDIHYIKLLEELVNTKRVAIDTENIEGILKNIYVSRGIVQSDVIYLGANTHSIYYLALAFRTANPMDSSYLDHTRSGSEKIKSILEKADGIK